MKGLESTIMMLFQPSKTTGLAIGLGALAGLLAACAGALALLLTQPVTALTAAWRTGWPAWLTRAMK